MRKRLRKKKDKQEVIKMVNEDSHIPYLIDLMDEVDTTKTIIMKGCSISHTCIGAHDLPEYSKEIILIFVLLQQGRTDRTLHYRRVILLDIKALIKMVINGELL